MTAANTDSVSPGDCMIGTSGKLYPVMELKTDLLKLKCLVWTITLDMCRNNPGKRGIYNKESVRKVELR